MKFLALFFGSWVYKPFSYLIKMILLCKGCKIGKNFSIMSSPSVLRKGGEIVFGDNVLIKGYLDIRTREQGKIYIGNNVKIDEHVRLIAANDATLTIGEDTNIGCYCIFNCGADVSVGKHCLIAAFCYIQSSNHGIKKGEYIKAQKHIYKPIVIGKDVWVGGSVNILPGAVIEEGCVIGAKSVVNNKIEAYGIAVGIPAKKIKSRS